MPTPVKWSAADFELPNVQDPEGEPWLSASPDGRFSLAYFETTGNPARLDAEEQLYSASGIGLSAPSTTVSAMTDEHQPAVAWFPDGRRVAVWTEEGRGGGGGEDIYARVYFPNDATDLSRFLVAGSGAGRQLDPVVAANADGFVIAFTDDSVAGGQLILNFYDISGFLFATVTGANGPQTVNQLSADQYRDVEITALSDGNYAVVWASDAPYDIWLRLYAPNGTPLTAPIDVSPGVTSEFLPDVTALADGRFVVTYERYASNTVSGRVFEADGTPSAAPFVITADAVNALNQQVQTAALPDGRFVTVWLNTAGNIEGQVMFADGTPDGAAFAVNGDGAGGKGRPTIATLADGRFAVSWESGAGATATIFTTIFEPREHAIRQGGTGLADDWVGTTFADIVFLGAGNDQIAAGDGNDSLLGEAGRDTLAGGAGADTLDGGGDADTLEGGAGDDRLEGGLGSDSMTGGDGNDRYFVSSATDQTVETNANPATGGTDTVYAPIAWTLGANVEILRIQGSDAVGGTGNGLNNRIVGNAAANLLQGLGGADRLEGGNGADTLAGGTGNDTLAGGAQADVFRFAAANAGVDTITDFNKNADRFDLGGGDFSAISVAANGDAVLTHDGGAIRIQNPPTLTLAQWNALVLPPGARAADVSDAGSDPSFASTAQDDTLVQGHHGDWTLN